jgi:hypothetical protein
VVIIVSGVQFDHEARYADVRCDVPRDHADAGNVDPVEQLATGSCADGLEVDASVVMTNKSLTGPNRGYACGHLYFETERMMDLLAEQLGLDPVEVRRKNLLESHQFPYRSPTGGLYDSGDYRAALEKALEVADYRGLRAQQAEARAAGRYVGVGVALAVDPSVSNMGYVATALDPQFRAKPEYLPKSGAVDAAILSEPFPTLAEEKGIAVRPLTKAPGAKPVPITAIFWNKEWAAANPDLANRVMVAYLKAARDLAVGDGWQGDKTLDVIVKFTPAKPDVLKKARPHALDANLEMDASVLDSMQKFNAELGYLKYKELQPVGKLFNFAYRDRAVQELGRK